MELTNRRLDDLHDGSYSNLRTINSSKTCGCFYCLRIFHSSQVKEYTNIDSTAMCPYCSIDSVLGDQQIEITPELLQQMKSRFFS